jgi:hypothetical protein
MANLQTLSTGDYTVGWIAPLEVEMIVAIQMLDEAHAPLPQHPGDHNVYRLGSINHHNVVIASLPGAGNSTAATVAHKCATHFPACDLGSLWVLVVVSRPTQTADLFGWEMLWSASPQEAIRAWCNTTMARLNQATLSALAL